MSALDKLKARVELALRRSDTRRVQEWLFLHGHRIDVDGIEGPATRAALEAFRRTSHLGASESDERTLARLVLPMFRALALEPVAGETLREAIVRVARAHLEEGAREAPGGNRGPWVRLYGDEGQPWCASFVTFALHQAADLVGCVAPLPGSASCDALAIQAAKRGRLVEGLDRVRVAPGDVVLLWKPIPGGHKDHMHTGFVEGIHADHLVTLEGNTNPAGGREGYEVERRIRALDRKDFIRLD